LRLKYQQTHCTDALECGFSSEGEITRSAFPKLALEVSLLEMMHVKKALPIDELISKIEKLQKTGVVATENIYTPPAVKPAPPKASQSSNDYQNSSKPEAAPPADKNTNKDMDSFLNFVRKNICRSSLSYSTETFI